MNGDLYKLLTETMEQNNKEVFSLLKIIHFYETVLFELKLMTDKEVLINESQTKKAEFVKQLIDLAENRTEKLMDVNLYDLYKQQTLLPKKAITRPQQRTKMQRTHLDVYTVYDSFVCGDEVSPKDRKLN
jgi:hypothetical protein